MKYIFVDDINYYRKKLKYFLVVYFLVFIVLLANNKHIDENFVLSILGLRADYRYILYVIYYFLALSISLLLGVIIYNKDLNTKFDNIFMRISVQKWYIAKMMSILFIVVLFKTFLYLIVSIFVKNIFVYFIKDVIVSLIVIDIFILCVSSFKKYSSSFGIFIIAVMLKFKYDVLILQLSNFYLTLLLLLFTILNLIEINKTINIQFERSDN